MPSFRDPRLTNELLLVLAGRRLLHRQSQAPEPDWRETEGLAAILDYARRLPQRDPWDLPGVYEGAPGLAGTLWQARQWAEERDHGA